MPPLQFEQSHHNEWQELRPLLARLHKSMRARASDGQPIAGERVAELYRRACEQLALARARAYPAYLVDRLEQLTADPHQLIYQQVELGWGSLKRMVTHDFPRAVRAHSAYIWTALAVFGIPTL